MTVLKDSKSHATMADPTENVSNNVKVIVRVRPPNDVETCTQRKNVVEIMNENILVFDPKEESSPFHSRKRRHRDIRKRRQKDLKFAFDHVFGWSSTNDEVFQYTTKTVLDGLLGGYNCSVFAYGATGAGKTHTMLGSESHPGVIYHTMIHLYKQISEISHDKTCDVAVSYLEVYNEQIRDLLMPRGTLPIREDHNAGVLVPGLSLHKPSTAEELLHMLQFGNKNRTQHPTDANAESSRSHAVFQVFVRQRERTANISAQVQVAKMCLVDLAGSERATVTRNQGARFREGANINRSLLALGNVINALADHKSKGHIPYRDSKLTRLLKDSLGGNCRTIMIAAVSPSELSYEDTYNTLKYADRAKNIRLNMKKNVLNVDFHVSRYGRIVEELRKEITELKIKLQRCEEPRLDQSLSVPPALQSLRESLQAAYNERRTLRDQQLQQETSVRDLQWRLYRKHKCLQRAVLLTQSQPQKVQTVIQGLQKKLVNHEGRRQTLFQQLQDNTSKLHLLHAQATAAAGDNKASILSQVVQVGVQKLALEVELNDSRHYVHHLRRLARAQEQEAVASETLVSALLQLVHKQQMELQRRGGVSPDIAAGYQSVCDLVSQWGVSFADAEEKCDGDSFHINNIIDIPLVGDTGVLDRVLIPVLPGAGCTTTVVTPTVPSNRAKPLVSFPGRRVNGQMVFSSPRPAPVSPAPTCTTPNFAASPHLAQTCGGRGPAETVEKENSVPVDDRPYLGNRDSCREGETQPPSTVHAGHTPNPKRLAHGSESSGAGVSAVTPTLTPDQTAKSGVSAWQNKPAASPSRAVKKLNETFSMDDFGSSNVCEDRSATMVLNKSSVLSLPVADSPSFRRVANSRSAAADSGATFSRVLNVSANSLNTASVLIPASRQTEVLGSSVASSVQLDPKGGVSGKGLNFNTPKEGDENAGSQQKSSSVKRAIDFDEVSVVPTKVENKSYADAVRTPTPPRQPLQNLDLNSPQVLTSNLQAALNQTPKSLGQGSMYIVNSQALDNMRRLRQLGMPSLVENLVTGNKSGQSQSQGGCRPSYMQPTKATAQRMRQQQTTRDDSFFPRRVQRKTFAHSRSKSASTSNLTKGGWKI